LPWILKNYQLQELTTTAGLRRNVASLFRKYNDVQRPEVVDLLVYKGREELEVRWCSIVAHTEMAASLMFVVGLAQCHHLTLSRQGELAGSCGILCRLLPFTHRSLPVAASSDDPYAAQAAAPHHHPVPAQPRHGPRAEAFQRFCLPAAVLQEQLSCCCALQHANRAVCTWVRTAICLLYINRRCAISVVQLHALFYLVSAALTLLPPRLLLMHRPVLFWLTVPAPCAARLPEAAFAH
jgi:hypothetical protein